MRNKILAIILAVLTTVNMSICVLAAEETELSLTYAFDNNNAGIADGDVVISGVDATKLTDSSVISLYWGNKNGSKLTNYDAISVYSKNDYVESDRITYDISGSRLLPSDAESLVVEVSYDGNTVAEKTKVDIEESKRMPDDKPNYSMFWISDIHVDAYSYAGNSRQRTALKTIYKFYEQDKDLFKGVVINGDLTQNGYSWQFNTLEAIIDEEIGKKFPVYYTTGNHDTAEKAGALECQEEMEDYFSYMDNMGYSFERTDKWSYDTWINGEHYIFCMTPYGDSWGFGVAHQSWLESKLCESDGKPTYVFSHIPIAESGIKMPENSSVVKIRTILDRHPGVIAVTSHLHTNLNDYDDTALPALTVDPATTSFIDTASSGQITEGGTDCFGRYVQIFSDKVVVRSVNFTKNGNWSPRSEYVIPRDNTNGFTGTPSIDYTDLQVGKTLTAKLNGNDVPTDSYNCEWFVRGASAGTGTTYVIPEGQANVNVSLCISKKNEPEIYAWATTSYFNFTPPVYDDVTGEEELPTEIVYTNDNTVKFENGIVKISGKVDASNAGKRLLLLVSSKDDVDTIKYINECVIGSDGTYVLKFKEGTINSNDYLRAKIQKQDVTNSIISAKDASENSLDLTLILDDENKPVVSIKNNYLDSQKADLIIAAYDEDGILLKTNSIDYDVAFGAYGEVQKYVDTVAAEGAKVKVFLWKGDTLVPLAPMDWADIN